MQSYLRSEQAVTFVSKLNNMKVKEANFIDVTLLVPRMKHPTIFQRFDELSDGEDLTISNDHDPKPLYYQLLSERGEIFQWDYLQQGPERWVVRITKNISANSKTVGEIAASDWRKADVFRKFGIDFCCGGKKTLEEACAESNVDRARLESELNQLPSVSAARPLPFNEWKLDFLADYIVNTHHTYVRKSLPDIRGYAYKVAAVHGEFHPEVREVHRLVEDLAEELTSHLAKEENILFPYVKALVSGEQITSACNFGSVANPIAVMEHEHDSAGEILRQIRALTHGYKVPADACASYNLLYKMLEEFETDLHTHIHLENNILFPKALTLERERAGEK